MASQHNDARVGLRMLMRTHTITAHSRAHVGVRFVVAIKTPTTTTPSAYARTHLANNRDLNANNSAEHSTRGCAV
jgi:hypothetical protein